MPDEFSRPEEEDAPLPLDELVERLYTRLKAVAERVRWGPQATRPTSLLHDAYLKLKTSRDMGPKAATEIIGIFAHVMRQIMVDAARRARSRKRGGGLVTPLETNDGGFESLAAPQTTAPEDVIAVDRALTELAIHSPRQAKVFEHKYFLGMTVPEMANVLGVAVVTVERDWREGKKFLSERLRSGA